MSSEDQELDSENILPIDEHEEIVSEDGKQYVGVESIFSRTC